MIVAATREHCFQFLHFSIPFYCDLFRRSTEGRLSALWLFRFSLPICTPFLKRADRLIREIDQSLVHPAFSCSAV